MSTFFELAYVLWVWPKLELHKKSIFLAEGTFFPEVLQKQENEEGKGYAIVILKSNSNSESNQEFYFHSKMTKFCNTKVILFEFHSICRCEK